MGKTVNFVADAYKDFTIHKDEERKQRYIDRQKTRKIGEHERLHFSVIVATLHIH